MSLTFGFNGDVQAFTDFATAQQVKAELRMCRACGQECTLPEGHQGKHRNNTGFFWGCDERLKGD